MKPAKKGSDCPPGLRACGSGAGFLKHSALWGKIYRPSYASPSCHSRAWNPHVRSGHLTHSSGLLGKREARFMRVTCILLRVSLLLHQEIKAPFTLLFLNNTYCFLFFIILSLPTLIHYQCYTYSLLDSHTNHHILVSPSHINLKPIGDLFCSTQQKIQDTTYFFKDS